jgi:hypothetical protein
MYAYNAVRAGTQFRAAQSYIIQSVLVEVAAVMTTMMTMRVVVAFV